METLTIMLLTVVIALLAGALAWYGPRRRHWQTHPKDRDHRSGKQRSPDEGGRPDELS